MREGIPNSVVICENAGAMGVFRMDLEQETAWPSVNHMSDLLGRRTSVISRHYGNCPRVEQLERGVVVARNATTDAGGRTYQVKYLKLYTSIAIGYWFNSSHVTHFHEWGTHIGWEHRPQDWTLNRDRFETNARELEASLAGLVVYSDLANKDTIIRLIMNMLAEEAA